METNLPANVPFQTFSRTPRTIFHMYLIISFQFCNRRMDDLPKFSQNFSKNFLRTFSLKLHHAMESVILASPTKHTLYDHLSITTLVRSMSTVLPYNACNGHIIRHEIPSLPVYHQHADSDPVTPTRVTFRISRNTSASGCVTIVNRNSAAMSTKMALQFYQN